MSIDNSNILAELRALLLLHDPVTDLVDMRIRVDGFAADDGQQPAIMLELNNADETPFLGEEAAAVQADILVTCRSINETQRTQLAGAVRDCLQGYRGPAGLGWIDQCVRANFAAGKLYDEDGDETDLYEQRDLYRVLFRI